MPLSEQEKRVLDELEAQLAADDPRFASAMVTDPHRVRRRRRIMVGAVACVLGIALLVLAVVIRQPLLGVVGFIAITLGVAYAIGEPKRQLHVVPQSQASSPKRSRAPRRSAAGPNLVSGQRNFMSTIEDRWERRRREGQGRW